jgi:uncharacterized membrane protein YphA (DoxX/SURF4 family)
VFKWNPAFSSNFSSFVSTEGQPAFTLPWFNFWTSLVSLNPQFFALSVALIETFLAFALIFGFARKFSYFVGGFFFFIVWSVAEGFGGPYTAMSTDIGTGIIYVFVLACLALIDYYAGESRLSLDYYISKKIQWWHFIK